MRKNKNFYFIKLFEFNSDNLTEDSVEEDSRVIGFFDNFEKAERNVLCNGMDMWETCYDYAVIEEVMCNKLYPINRKRLIYKYNALIDDYEKIEEPESFKNMVNNRIVIERM